MTKLHRNDLFGARQPVQHATLGVGKILDVLGKKARVQIGKTVYIIHCPGSLRFVIPQVQPSPD